MSLAIGIALGVGLAGLGLGFALGRYVVWRERNLPPSSQ